MANPARWMVPVAAVVTLAMALMPAGVSAHADYDHSTPGKDEVVQAPPVQVDVFFKQDVFKQEGRNYVRVFNDANAQMSTGDGTVDDDNRRHIIAALPTGLADGRYIVRWMTTSDEDGDEEEGAFCFYVAVQPTPEQQAECAAFEPTPANVGTATVAGGSGSTPGAATDAVTTATAQPTATGEDTDDGDSNTGLIILGIVAGGIAAVVIVGGVVVWLRRTLE